MHCMYTHNYYKIFFTFFFTVYKNERKEHKFDSKNIKKATSTIKTKRYLIWMILMLIKYQSLKKNNTVNIIHLHTYFIGYNDNDVIRPSYLFLSQTIGYINKFDKNKITMSLMIKDIQLFKKYNKIWKKN